jgi:hypothetical protein
MQGTIWRHTQKNYGKAKQCDSSKINNSLITEYRDSKGYNAKVLTNLVLKIIGDFKENSSKVMNAVKKLIQDLDKKFNYLNGKFNSLDKKFN